MDNRLKAITEFVDKEDLARFPKLELLKINDIFGSWKEAQKAHFDDAGSFDLIYK